MAGGLLPIPCQSLEAIVKDGLTDVGHQANEEAKIVQRGQAVEGDLARSAEVPQVGSRMAAAGGAIAVGIDGAIVVRETSIPKVDSMPPFAPDEDRAVPCQPSRRGAVKRVNASADALEDVDDLADAKQMTCLV